MAKSDVVEIVALKYNSVKVSIIGTSPMLQHRYSAKARQELLLPGRKKNRAARETSLKHDPVKEFREALYLNRGGKEAALFHIPTPQIRQAIASAALDMPGDAKRTEVLRWISVSDPNINLFGIPRLHMSMTRSSGITRTPDVRTRPVFPEWAASFIISFPAERITSSSILALIDAAGQLCGIGDWRPQKGGDYGRFRVIETGRAKEFNRIVADQGSAAQSKAFENPECYDEETQELFSWFLNEAVNREFDPEIPDVEAAE